MTTSIVAHPLNKQSHRSNNQYYTSLGTGLSQFIAAFNSCAFPGITTT